jgi:ATP-dependent Clp protease ATP-binding subunit ClpA
MFDELGDRARAVVTLARREALQREDSLVLPAHLLVGLLEEGSPDGAGFLARIGLTAESVRTKAARSFSSPGAGPGALARISDAVEEVLDAAGHLAQVTQRKRVEPGHLLLTLLETVPFEELIGRSTLFHDLGLEEAPLRAEVFRWYHKHQTKLQRSVQAAVSTCLAHDYSRDVEIPILRSIAIHRHLVSRRDWEGAVCLRGTLVMMGKDREETPESWRWLVDEAVEEARLRCGRQFAKWRRMSEPEP